MEMRAGRVADSQTNATTTPRPCSIDARNHCQASLYECLPRTWLAVDRRDSRDSAPPHPPVLPQQNHVGPALRPFFATCGETREKFHGAEIAVFQAYASVAQANGATWRVIGKWTEFYARQTRIAALAECDLSTVKRETRALIQAGRLIRIQTARGRIPHAYQVVPEGLGTDRESGPLTPARGATQAPRRPPGRTARQLTVTPLNSVERSHRPPNRALAEPSTANTAAAGVLPAVPKGEQQSKGQQQQQRINGMLASCEISARILDVDFDTADHRQRLSNGALTVTEMQTFTDDLRIQRTGAGPLLYSLSSRPVTLRDAPGRGTRTAPGRVSRHARELTAESMPRAVDVP